MKRRTITAALSTLTLGIIVAGCGSIDESASAGTESETESNHAAVTVGTLRAQPHLYTPHFYEQFAPEGVEFEIVLFDTSTDIKNAVVSGSIDFGVTGAASVISGVSQGEGVTIVASSADGGTRIVASAAIADVEELTGATIGYPMGATQEILLNRTLEAQGIDPESDVDLVNLPFSDMANALSSGQVDAFISAEVGPSISLQEGAHELLSAYETPIGRTNIVLATSHDLVESDPGLVQQVVDTHAATTDFMLDNTDEWAEGLVNTFSLDQAVVDTAIENIWPRWNLDAEYVATLEAMSTEMVEFGQTAEPADTTELVTTTFADDVGQG